MSELTRWEQVAWGAALLLALLVPALPWLERTFDPRIAVVLAALHNAGQAELDPWGRPWGRLPARGAGLYSFGPDGVDDRGAADDLIVDEVFATLDDHAWIPRAVLYSPRRALAVAAVALALWTFATRRAIRAPRDDRRAREALRAAAMVVVPACAGWLWLLADAADPEPKGIARLGLAVPLAWAALCFLAALAWRLTRPVAQSLGPTIPSTRASQ